MEELRRSGRLKGKGPVTGDDGEAQGKDVREPVKRTKGESSKAYVFQTRTSPKPLYNAMLTLKPIQKACLEQNGFGNLLDFKVDGIPSKLGFYVVDNFDPKNMEIKMARHSLVITRQSIGEMLGINNEGLDILEEEKTNDEEMIKNWTEQFEKEDITPSDVKSMIRKSKVADINFKLNFLVLFTSVMGNVKPKGICDLSILEYISTTTDFSSINWCSYVWRCLQTCKNGWKRDKTYSYFLGSITFLTMMYVDGMVCNAFNFGRKRPPTTFWTHELLREREIEEIKSGLGNGELQGPYVEEEIDPMPETVEGFVWKLKKYVECIYKERTGFEKTLLKAIEMFPGNNLVSELSQRYTEALKYQPGGNEGTSHANVHTEDEPQNATLEVDLGEGIQTYEAVDLSVSEFDSPAYIMGPLTQQEVWKSVDRVDADIEYAKKVSDWDAPSFSLGLTPDFVKGPLDTEYAMGTQTQNEVVETVDRVATALSSKKSVKSTLGIPRFNLDMAENSESAEGKKPVKGKKPMEAVPLRVLEPVSNKGDESTRRDKRIISLTAKMKSPYYARVTDADSEENAREKRVTKYLFNRMSSNHSDVLFETTFGHQSSREQMLTLGPQESVATNVIDSWCAVLNALESLKDKNSPLRLFLPTFVVDTSAINDEYAADALVKNYLINAETANAKDGRSSILKGIDLVFIPVCNDQHQFLVCFNLKKPAVSVIDNKKNEKKNAPRKRIKTEKMEDMRVASMLHTNFGQYMLARFHAKAKSIINADLERGKFNWQTDEREKDSGVFLMRHMETYKGTGMGKWNCGLDADVKKQLTQLGRLRKKYAARILLSDCNIHKEKIRAESDQMEDENVHV
ncbi:hypothetical protein CTI12_AA075780 [Artemisia annua]|uniref:Ulp1 protease family, C-terminal catalytic domain-containing protein n=1 Tax=Artemisia annua TaxID=35608 RepID=A0A2U1Q4T8_ARTAN|nr:hypothetical protein CTI12_AA075780 [Artemisia annua]